MFKKIWLVFCAIFLALGIFHWWLSTHAFPPLTMNLKGSVAKVNGIPTANKAFKNFVNEVNNYIRNYNESSKWQNLAATVGYFSATLMAFISFLSASNILGDRRRIHTVQLPQEKKVAKITTWVLVIAGSILLLIVIKGTSFLNKNFFETYKNIFSGLSYATVAAGLIFTWVQIRAAIRRSRANTSYQIHKDGREIFLSLSDEIINYIEGTDPEETELDKVRAKAERKIHEILMYYASVYQQWRFGNIDDQFLENVILKEFCSFLRRDRVKEYWEDNIVSMGLFDEGFIRIGQRCFD